MLAPLFVEAYNNRGNAYDEKGQPDRAIEDYNNAITIDPNYPDSYFNRGITYTRLNKIDSAILDFQKACDMGSNKSCIALTRALEKR
ncbi:MAG: tetratricopeptide repeat protein, partial [Thermodesulfovibrionales bacterium]|nr:tetratricopeptide repeat protein [Thermodesulfovibrionales bacterium]